MRDSKGKFVKGYKLVWTEEMRQKHSLRMKGVNTWSKGKALSEKHKTRIKKNNSKFWLGKKRPEMVGNQFSKGNKPNATSFKEGQFAGELNPHYGKINHNHPVWKDIKQNPLHQSIRQLFQYRQWRLQILERDNHSCVLCGSEKHIEVDHFPKDFDSIVAKIETIEQAIDCEELWDINNGRSLCVKCHQKTPNYFWRGKK